MRRARHAARDSIAAPGEYRKDRYFGGMDGAITADQQRLGEAIWTRANPFMTQTGDRRSARVLLDVPLLIWGESPDQVAFREETFTVTVSAHGALVMLATGVSVGQRVLLRKLTDSVEIGGKIAYKGMPYAGLTQVGIELDQPSPEFWPVSQPPTDWITS
ncbi:MAG TPA: hypothetical protein VIY66_10080 [Candidatus Acidoferrales bacterium]